MKDYAKIITQKEKEILIKEKTKQILDEAFLITSGFFACIFFILVFFK